MLNLDRSSAAATTPVTLAEVKTHLRITGTDEDAAVTRFIGEATDWAEEFLRASLVTQTWVLKLDRFPVGDGPIDLPRGPVQSITSVAYLDSAGASQTLAEGTDFQLKTDPFCPQIAPEPGQCWPSTECERREAVTITYVAGYGDDETAIPDDIRHGVIRRAALAYNSRGDDGPRMFEDGLKACELTLAPQRRWVF